MCGPDIHEEVEVQSQGDAFLGALFSTFVDGLRDRFDDTFLGFFLHVFEIYELWEYGYQHSLCCVNDL